MLNKAKPYHCFSSLISDIIKKITDKYISEESIFDYFDVNIPNELLEIKSINELHKKGYRTKDLLKYGLNITESELHSFIKNKELQIDFQQIPIKTLTDWNFEENIVKLIPSNHLILTLDYNRLFNITNEYMIGHAVYINQISESKIQIFDPGPKGYGFKIVDSYDLFYSSLKINGALWVFNNKTPPKQE